MNLTLKVGLWLLLSILAACNSSSTVLGDDDTVALDCEDVATIEPINQRGGCTETLAHTPEVTIAISGDQRIFSSNAIPDHRVGLFGGGAGSLNNNAISPIEDTYSIPLTPTLADSPTYLLDPTAGPRYEFGILLNGVSLDPEAAEPWPHDGLFSFSTKNWNWNLDAMNINLGLDCNNAHVQPSGKYHYHGAPTLYLESLDLRSDQMTLIGYAADGFPLYYQDGSPLSSSFRLKTGERPGDGESAPCGEYTGIYTNDFEYVEGLGDLDECNGRYGATPEYPSGTYYYVLTSTFPFLPRCLKGTPSADFRLR